MADTEGEKVETTVGVLEALRQGLGVEDMEVRGVASADYARGVIDRLRRNGLLAQVVRSRR